MQVRTAAIGVTALATLGAGAGALWWWQCARDWIAWQEFAELFIQSDGRVIDYLADDRSTSEGQAYAMFFALVANDQQRFEATLTWAENNLAAGDLTRNLPAWLWGQTDNGEWQVLDSNPASDADLWLAYSLLEADRLWQMPAYAEKGRAVLELTRQHSVAELPGIGQVLLPAPRGFHPEPDLWRLNPSYVPAFLLAGLAGYDPTGPWAEIAENHARLLKQNNRNGLAPDWLAYRAGQGVVPDPDTGNTGSYDAIRVYLWSGLWPQGSPSPQDVAGMARLLAQHGKIPETVDTVSGRAQGEGPSGFYGALLPYLSALDQPDGQHRLATPDNQGGYADPRLESSAAQYYDHVLILFGQGWLNQRYRIVENGRIKPFWSQLCCELYH